MKVLVADDDPAARALVEAAAKDCGYEAQGVGDGLEAWAAFQAAQPDVFLACRVLPGIGGLELCRRVREAGGPYTYFILMTARGEIDRALEGIDAGADDYLGTPIDQGVLRIRLRAAERLTALQRALEEQRGTLERLNRELAQVARTDTLTGLGNRLRMNEDLDQLLARVRRYRERACVALVDVDRFKRYNDTYGHAAGDDVLRTLAAMMRRELRSGDGAYRFGGEEFVLIFAGQSTEDGHHGMERLRRRLTELAIPHEDGIDEVVTVSAGLTAVRPDDTADELLRRADALLYAAKHAGRNRVCADFED
jgi:two-component system, cell cycle response regulator